MFLTKRRFILKTCGTTLPLQCLELLLTLVEKHAGFDEIEVNNYYTTFFFNQIFILKNNAPKT